MLEIKLTEAGTLKKLLDGTQIFNTRLSPILLCLFCFFPFSLAIKERVTDPKLIYLLNLVQVYETKSELSFVVELSLRDVDRFIICEFNAQKNI